MNKTFVIYKFLLSILILISILLVGIMLDLKIERDRVNFINSISIDYEREFEQANKNSFTKFKNDLLDKEIVLDNISTKDGKKIRFDIYKDMYFSELNEFINFLKNVPYLNISNLNIEKNNFNYSISMSAEI